MPVHGFIDESVRDRQYLLCVTVVEPAQLSPTRKRLQQLLLPGARELHFNNEKSPRRRQLIDQMAALTVTSRIYLTQCAPKAEELGRQRCLDRAVTELIGLDAHRLVLDTRADRDAHDRRTLRQALGTRPSKTALTYEHLDSKSEPLLWLSDAIGWCYGAGNDWRRRATPLISAVVQL